MSMRVLAGILLSSALVLTAQRVAGEALWVTYKGQGGAGEGKGVVLVSGDEEYRSEQALPQLAAILAKHHGFRCTVLFAIDPATGEIDPNNPSNIPGLEALADADVMIIATRFRDLPDEQMKVAPASVNECYLYGGKNAKVRRDLYLYRKDGMLLHLLRAPAPITAIAGNREFTFLAIGPKIYLFTEGKPLLLVYSTDSNVTSLAVSPPAAIFFATANSVGYVSEPGRGFSFVQGKGAKVQVRDGSLFLFFPDQGIMKCSPISGFVKMAEDLQQAVDDASRPIGNETQ